jgi:hypothetical protein
VSSLVTSLLIGWLWETARIEAKRGGIRGDGNTTLFCSSWLTSGIPTGSLRCRDVVDKGRDLRDVVIGEWSRKRGGVSREGVGPAVEICGLPMLLGERDVTGLVVGEWKRFPGLARLQKSTVPEGCN